MVLVTYGLYRVRRGLMQDDSCQRSAMQELFSRLAGIDPFNYQGFRHYLMKFAQMGGRVASDFLDDQCFLRASALAFTTILSFVPFFALTFAVLKGLGVQNEIEPYLIQQVAVGQEELVDKIITYINNTKMTSVGAIGLVSLLFTVIALLGNIEESFNSIWGVKETRSLYRKFSDYLSVVVSAPLLLFAATSVTTTLQNQNLVQWLMTSTYLGDVIIYAVRFVPYISMWVAFMFLYIFIPNTRIRFKSAAIGGIFAGTIWQLAQWGFIHFQVGVAKYNAIYGTLALVPIFMVWIYISWVIVLLGLEVVYAHQNLQTFRREVGHKPINYAGREMVALLVLYHTVDAFYRQVEPWNAERLAAELDMPVRFIRDVIDELIAFGYLVESGSEIPAFLPAKAPEHMVVRDILKALKKYGEDWLPQSMSRGGERLSRVVSTVEQTKDQALAGMTMRDVVVEAG
jgi:membrane protein